MKIKILINFYHFQMINFLLMNRKLIMIQCKAFLKSMRTANEIKELFILITY